MKKSYPGRIYPQPTPLWFWEEVADRVIAFGDSYIGGLHIERFLVLSE